jgi:hypothetical protein
VVDTPQRRGAGPVAVAQVAAGLSFGAALLHGSVIATHFREYFLFGLFFAIVTPLQLVWAELVRRRPADRFWLAVGAVGNLAIALTWTVSRTVGLPFGPERFEAEALGVKDVLATADELGIALLVGLLLLRRGERPAPTWVVVVAWAAVAVSVAAAMVAGH